MTQLVFESSDKARKALVTMAIEKALFAISKKALDEVSHRLYRDYKCYLHDCYEHPQYLKRIMQDLYGKSSTTIIDSIKDNLKELETQKEIADFITEISG